MKLYIDTSDRNKQIVRLNGKTFEVKGDLVSFLAKILKKEKISLDQIKAIKIKKGPGSFTGLRMGAAAANALRYALGMQKGPKDIILPKYGKPPKITRLSASGGKRKRPSR